MKNTKKITYSLSGLVCLVIASFLFTCTEVPDYCSRGERYDPNHQFCFGGQAYKLCGGGKDYNPLTEGCDRNNAVGTMCADSTFVPQGTQCGGYALSTASAPANGGTVTVTRTSPEGQNFAAGELVTLTAAAANNFEFIGWAGAETSVGATITLSMNSDKPMVAMFSPRSAAGAATHTLATTAFPANGGAVTRNPNAASYAAGTEVTVTATPNTGYNFTGWSGASAAGSSTTTITMDNGKTLVAMFASVSQTLTVNANPASGGTVFVNGTASAGATSHNTGASVRVIARAADGYEFTGWSGASTSAGAEVTVSMNTNQMLTANFRRQRENNDTTTTPPAQYTLTVNRSPASGGAVAPESGLKHDAGTPVAITASAAEGYTFVNWTVTGGGTVANLNSTNTTVTLTANAAVTANFRVQAVVPGEYTLTINREPAEGGAVFADDVALSGTVSYEPETQVSVRAEAAVGYRFTGWTGALTSTNNPLTVNMRANVTLTANFEYIGIYTLTVNRNPAVGGRVFVNNVESAATTVAAGVQVTVRAEANADYAFTGWSGASTATAPSVTVTMNRDSTITANFREIVTFTGTLTDSRDGKTYNTVTIGGQTWMAENLNFAGHLLGDSWCYGGNDSNCDTYGRLYDWAAVMDGAASSSTNPSGVRGICPEGWHVPSDAEWTALTGSVGGASTAGRRLKAESGWGSSDNSVDDFGFSALPGGYRDTGGSFNGVGSFGGWWSATEGGASNAYNRNMYSGYDYVGRDNYGGKGYGCSLRCRQD